MPTLIQRFLQDEEAATAIEYVLIASFISVFVIVGATVIGSSLNTTFQSISSQFSGPAS